MEVVWLSNRPAGDPNAFVLVLQEGTPRNIPEAKPQQPLGPLSHLGFALESREEVDKLALGAKNEGLLRFGPTFLNPYAGYLCIIGDPEGHNVEFSHAQSLVNSLSTPEQSSTKSAAPWNPHKNFRLNSPHALGSTK